MTDRPWLTVFAGPNGSGKSTLYREIAAAGHDLGTYINADDLAAALHAKAQAKGRKLARQPFEWPAFIEAGQRRQHCLEVGAPFAFETVFSHPSKIEFIKLAKAHGFNVMLLAVSTESVDVNVARVKKRVAEGGHDVPLDKILSRFPRAVANLAPASLLADEAYLFDNSGPAMRLAASVTRGPCGKPALRFAPPPPAWVLAWAQRVTALVSRP